MPQIWLTYDELAVLMGCDAAGARATAAAIPLDRRRSRDGHTRAKLNAALEARFLELLMRQRIGHEIAACARDLAMMRRQMAPRPLAARAALPTAS